MPGSSALSWRGLLALGLAVLCVALALVVGRVVWFDPYWVFRREPPWRAQTDGANKLLDRQMRRAKTLQALTRSYDTVLVGSSTTYHGLDPREADPGRVIYNAGISGILADELPTIAAVVASRADVRRVAIGLDYYMFSRTDREVRLDRGLETSLGRANVLIGATLGRYALHDARLREVAAATDPGEWTYAGFRITPKLTADLTQTNDAVRRRTTSALQPATYAGIERMLDILFGRQVDLYLAPVSPAQRRVLADLGHMEDFERWRRDMAALAGRRGVRFHDLTSYGADDAFDPRTGSTDIWLDNLHYTPRLGRRVLAALGLRVQP